MGTKKPAEKPKKKPRKARSAADVSTKKRKPLTAKQREARRRARECFT